jgi:hypothetical protein
MGLYTKGVRGLKRPLEGGYSLVTRYRDFFSKKWHGYHPLKADCPWVATVINAKGRVVTLAYGKKPEEAEDLALARLAGHMSMEGD